jgi:predicted DNA-binding transcriptional regulator YafY
MANNQKALKRYRIILKILSREGSYSSKYIHSSCLNSGIKVGYRTIQKDLEDLRDDHTIFGVNLGIKKDEKEKKWYSDGIPKEIFSALELKGGEVDALLFYAKAINQYSDYPIFKDISHAMKKVVESSNISEDRKRLFNLENLIEAEKHPPISGIEFITDLLTAISDRKIIELEYEPFGRDIKIHRVKPILLKEDKLMWYLIGINIKYDSLITFALDRVNNIAITGEGFDKIEFNSSEHFKNSFGITVSEEEPIEVVIIFELRQAYYLKTLPIHQTQEIVKETKNQLTIKVNVKPSYEFFSKIRSYGSGAMVISPKSIRDVFIKDLKQVKANYKLD